MLSVGDKKKRKFSEIVINNSFSALNLEKVSGDSSLNSTRICHHVRSTLKTATTDNVSIFIRQEVLRFNQTVEGNIFLVITGSPGIGKSISSWMWLCDSCCKDLQTF